MAIDSRFESYQPLTLTLNPWSLNWIFNIYDLNEQVKERLYRSKVKGLTYPSSPNDSLPKQTIIMEVRFKTPVTLAKSLPPFKSITVSKVWMFQFRWHATIWVESKKYFVTQTTEGFDVTENGKPKEPIYIGNGRDFQKWITYLAANTRR